jgi:rsbT co-antagonist protein RsbR
LSWRLVLAQDSDVALAPAWRPIGSAALVALLLALATSGVALLIGTHVTRPINQLAHVAQEGNLETLAAAPTTDVQHEVGQLRAGLGRLARSVLDSRRQIEAVNRSLEGAVAERTAELHAVVQRQEELLTTQNRLLQQIADMAMPVLPIRPGVIVMPLVGAIDGARADSLAARLLRGIEKQRAQVALIDITGVPLVDTQVAETLLQAIGGARLLGAQALLVGIRPEIAQTLVGLGVDLRDLETTATLQEGLARAQTMMTAYARR